MIAPHELFWKLPGPSSFLKHVVDGVEGGEVLIFFAPQHSPQELQQVMREAIHDRTHHQVHTAALTPGKTVDDAISEALSKPRGTNLETLLGDPANDDKLVHVVGGVGDQDVLMSLLRRVDAFRKANKPRARQMGLWLDLQPNLAMHGDAMLRKDGVYRFCFWYDRVSRADMRAYVSALPGLDAGEPHGILREVICEYAGFDRDWADKLATLPQEHLLDPARYLHVHVDQTWEAPKWTGGAIDALDGQEVISSKYLARLRAHTTESPDSAKAQQQLELLLWKAQVQTIFPWLELVRPDALATVEGELRPFVESNQVMDVRDGESVPYEWAAIEYGDACRIIKEAQTARIRVKANFIHTAKKVRNKLAHRQIVAQVLLERLWDERPKP